MNELPLTGPYRTRRAGGFPSFAKEGWLRIKKMAPFLIGADGVVVSSYRLFIPNRLIIGCLKQLPRPLLSKDASQHFLLGRVHPSFAKEGNPLWLTRRVR